MSKMKIAVTGAAGRMGRELIRTIHGREDCVVAGAIEQEGSIALGQDIGLLAGLGKLGVAPHVAELTINHARRGIETVYDKYRYEDEIKTALTLWADCVLSAVEGQERKVVPLRGA